MLEYFSVNSKTCQSLEVIFPEQEYPTPQSLLSPSGLVIKMQQLMPLASM